MKNFSKRSWVEVDLSKIKTNYETYRKMIPDNTDIMAVVKADGYGHGAVQVSQILQSIGCKNFAVSNINEAIELRESGLEGQILILGYTPLEEANNLIKYDITQTLLSEEYTNDLMSMNKFVKCQFAIDTGMNRIGLNANDIASCRKLICKAAENLDLTGLFTHLCVADIDEKTCTDFTDLQIKKFKTVADSVADLKLTYIHCLNTAGGLWHYNSISNLARLGIALYGLKPDYSNVLPDGIEPAMAWKSVVSMIKTVYPGETIGYGRTFIASKEMKIATIPTGYADGYNRFLSNKGCVLLYGRKAPIVGKICMDQFMVDVTDIPEVKAYDEVVLLGRSGNMEITADDIGNSIGTIGYEIVCGISKRVDRIYCKQN